MARRDERFDSKTLTQNVCLKGVGGMDIFVEDADREKFIDSLYKACEKYDVTVLVFALMDNHVHMILAGEIEQFQYVFESIGATYARAFNKKYGRSGHFFDQRYYNGCINSQKQFLKTASYIFNNPVEAGIVKSPKEYQWSNFNDLRHKTAEKDAMEKIDELVNLNHLITFALMMAKKKMPSKLVQFLEKIGFGKKSDEEARKIAIGVVGADNIGRIPKIRKEKRRDIVEKMWQEGASIPQISRVTALEIFEVEQIVNEIVEEVK